MSARTIANSNPGSPPAPRFDAKFIEEHQLIERYLDNRLPPKGARELENWCRQNPGFLEGLNLSVRAQASLKLLDAIGQPVDLQEPKLPWWKSPYLPIGLGIVALLSLVAFWSLFGKYLLLRSELDDTRIRMSQGSLVQPSVESSVQIAPDRAAGINHARISVNHSAPQLMDLHIDLSYSKATQFRLIIDKQDQGRALILNGLLKDSNGELRFTFNTSGLNTGTYLGRIEAIPLRGGAPIEEGWLILDVR